MALIIYFFSVAFPRTCSETCQEEEESTRDNRGSNCWGWEQTQKEEEKSWWKKDSQTIKIKS